MSDTSQSNSEALEIALIRPPGRGAVFLRSSYEHPGMLVVIGFEGLPHGALIGLDAENRARLRQWLDAQESALLSIAEENSAASGGRMSTGPSNSTADVEQGRSAARTLFEAAGGRGWMRDR